MRSRRSTSAALSGGAGAGRGLDGSAHAGAACTDDAAGLSIAGDWVRIDDVAKASLPTVFRKAWSAVCAG